MKKTNKVISLLLALILVVGVFAACSNGNNNSGDTSEHDDSSIASDANLDDSSSDVDTDLGSDTEEDAVGGPIEGVETADAYDLPADKAFVEFNGKKVNLPCSYNDFMAIGFTLPEENEPEVSDLDGNTHGSLEVSSGEDEGIHVGITLYNPDKEAKDFKECQVYSVIVDTYEADFAPSKVKLGDLDYSDSPESLIKRYGNPTTTYGGYGSDMYTWADANRVKGFDVAWAQESGKLYSISLVNYTWELPDDTTSSADSSAPESGVDNTSSTESEDTSSAE